MVIDTAIALAAAIKGAELLDVSRLEARRLVLHRQPTDLAALAAGVTRRVGREYPELEARLDFAPDFPKVCLDADKIEQVLVNLLENACKHASPKGVSITGTALRHEVSVTVADQGIPPDDETKVSDRFFREGPPARSATHRRSR